MSSRNIIPDFSTLGLGSPAPAGSEDLWQTAVKESTGSAAADLVWETPEGIGVKPLYTGRDLEGVDFLGTYPGIAPFLRGPYPT
ncbi:methylmalonyl-CoA mutase family protein, partial [Streptomyces sp. NPDC016469]|uniref:methylmalonyl-CoA mutase family protein n=1 Tax=Streptomyces sp. NPDC016469 TaxID=3157191 RepID=UPI0033DC8309